MHVANRAEIYTVCAATNHSPCPPASPQLFLIKNNVDVLETFDTYNAAWAYAQTLDVEYEIEFIPHHLEHEVQSTKPTQSDL